MAPLSETAGDHERGFAPDKAAELARFGAECGGNCERAAAFGETEGEHEARRGGAEHDSKAELDPRQAGQIDGGQARARRSCEHS